MNNMEETLIQFETAKLAQKKGYNRIPDEIEISNEVNYIKHFEIPTQALLQKWLREVHNIKVFIISTNFYEMYSYNIVYRHKTSLDFVRKITDYNDIYKTYEQALEVGLKQALELIP